MPVREPPYDPAQNQYPKMVYPPDAKPGDKNGKVVNSKDEEAAFFAGFKKAPAGEGEPSGEAASKAKGGKKSDKDAE